MEAEKIKITVHYIAASEPFKDHNGDPSETLGSLKSRVLDEFGLNESSGEGGAVKVYKLFNKKTELSDLAATLSHIAGGKSVLQINLVEELTQGQNDRSIV